MREDISSQESLRRIVDRYNGIKLCDMTPEQLEDFLGGIAQRGAYNALAHVGLHDKEAGEDIKDLRAVIKGYRVVKKQAWTVAWGQFWKVVSAILTLLLIGYFFGNSPHVKEAMRLIAQ